MVRVLAQWGTLKPVAQPGQGITYAPKIDKAESWLNWQLPAAQLARQLRAFDPFPGGASQLTGHPIKVWRAHVSDLATHAQPGQVLAVQEQGIDVATGQGVLRLTELQRPGGKRMACADFLRGHPVEAGTCFEASPP